jgi:hypothetical protein
MPSDRSAAPEGPCVLSCLSREDQITSALKDLTPFDLGKAATCIRRFLASLQFDEVLLSPFAIHEIDYFDNVVDVPAVGQLRFNTEPEIWESSKYADRFYSISSLFRKERQISPLRRSAFFVVDFYKLGAPESLLPIFWGMLGELAKVGFTERLSGLRIDDAEYDPSIDGPRCDHDETRWVLANGYDARHSFFEADERGESTRREVFLVTPLGHLEVGVFGITGWNKNPNYLMRAGADSVPTPDLRRSGMCFGLERLLLAEQILSIVDRLRR